MGNAGYPAHPEDGDDAIYTPDYGIQHAGQETSAAIALISEIPSDTIERGPSV